MSRPVRISEQGHKILAELAQEGKSSMTDVLDTVLLAEKRRRFFEGINAGYQELKADSNEWQQELAERTLYDNTLTDGIKTETDWPKGEYSHDKAL